MKNIALYTFPLIILLVFWGARFNYALIPVILCGEISLYQLFKEISKPRYTINAYFYTWLFVFISTCIAPLIHIYENFWMWNMSPTPDDWTDYAFQTSCMYLVGIIIWSVILQDRPSFFLTNNTKRRVLGRKWELIIYFFLTISLMAQIYVYYSAGGILGYIHLFTEGTREDNAFEGMGMFFILSESFPYTFLIYLILKLRGKTLNRIQFYIILFVLFAITLFFGGLRGSRSNTLLFLVIALITANMYLYKIQRADWIALFLAFFAFMYIGRMYKDYGENMFQESETTIQEGTGLNTFETTITGDLSRYAVNAYELYMLERNPNYSEYYGSTYLWGIFTFVPGGKYIIDYFHLHGRSHAASMLFFGNTRTHNSRILGPIGEWFLNFGVWSFFIIYIIIGFIIRAIRRYTCSISISDIRFFIVPSLMIFLPQLVLSDTSNTMFFFVKRVVVVYIILYCISKKEKTTI